ncbi:MAG: GNAT family N-acetyltransferase [Paraglaciecola sp.]|uniref:GNAT family N-acetyltransferase n=1 Tax=Paraglaciecola sp. TaxID=1920173 RepID=UPI00273FC72C|nr:GNAT family N-acetyltransferase [Paraglaciecola sp.]MDP5030751.1 GNAT family N-acetyltransferase [Paraglaciecola sp.]MDP5132299.1 GNAT family N-acetyltransferase [Paraglaciecola sp.]
MNSDSYHLECISDPVLLDNLKESWHELWENQQGTFFQHFGWNYTWIKNYQSYIKHLMVLTVWYENTLIAVLPCYIRKHRLDFMQRQLWLIGTGEPEYCEVCPENNDILADDSHISYTIKLITDFFNTQKVCETIVFKDLLTNSRLSSLASPLKTLFPIQTLKKVGRGFNIPLFTENFGLKSSFIKKSKKLKNKLSKHQHELIFAKSSNEALTLYDELIKLHQYRWQKKGSKGVFSSLLFKDFHQEIIKDLFSKGNVILVGLKVNKDFVAINYCFLDFKSCYFYQSGVDTDYNPNLSPGLLLHFLLIEYFSNLGIESYDLMKSNSEKSYKSEIIEPNRFLYDLNLQSSIIHSTLFRIIEKFQLYTLKV